MIKIITFSFFTFLLVSCNQLNVESETKPPSLRANSEFPLGTAVRYKPFQKDLQLRQLQQYHFDSYTAGSDMKMNQVMPTEERFDFSIVDSIIAYANKHNQRVFGHNLIWHSSTPEWVRIKATENPDWLLPFMRDYIYQYIGRYKGQVHGWDVINEGINTKGAGFREDTIWYKIIGPKYIEKAFEFAHEADPEAILFYNDFNIERDLEKFNTMMTMIEDFQKRGVPISGIGFQMHIRMDIPNEIIAHTLKTAASTGLQIHLSEVDIIFNTHDDSRGGGIQRFTDVTEEMLSAQAKKYEDLVRIYKEVVPREQQYGITFWGFNDRDTWIRRFFKMKDWPTIYDENLTPKPAFYGFLKGLKTDQTSAKSNLN